MNIEQEKNSRNLSVTGQSTYLYQQAPTIRLHGKWLGKLGFSVGQKVLVEEEHKKLVISVIPRKQEEITKKAANMKASKSESAKNIKQK